MTEATEVEVACVSCGGVEVVGVEDACGYEICGPCDMELAAAYPEAAGEEPIDIDGERPERWEDIYAAPR